MNIKKITLTAVLLLVFGLWQIYVFPDASAKMAVAQLNNNTVAGDISLITQVNNYILPVVAILILAIWWNPIKKKNMESKNENQS